LLSTSFAWYVPLSCIVSSALLTCGSMYFICGRTPRNRTSYTTTSECTSPGPMGDSVVKDLIIHR
jgi:hypothetical protein